MNEFYVILGITVVAIAVILGFIASRYRKVQDPSKAVVVVGLKKVRASLVGCFEWPIVDSAKFVDISQQKLVIVRKGVSKDSLRVGEGQSESEYEGIHCKDNIRADLEVAFYLDLERNTETIVHAATKLGTHRVGNKAELKDHFGDKLSEALKSAVKTFDYEELHTSREAFANKVKEILSSNDQFDLCGYRLEDVTIDKIDQTSLKAHDPDNVLDSEGIQKITEITANRKVATNKLSEEEKTRTRKDTVEQENIRADLDKQKREAKARTDREAAVIEAAEKAKTREEVERNRAVEEQAQIKANQEVAVRQEEMNREVESVKINNERVVEIEREKVERARRTEEINTVREVELLTLEKEGDLEDKRRGVAEKEAVRVGIERGIAKEKEETQNLIAKETAEREKLVLVTDAEARAEAEQVGIIKVAQAKKDAAEHAAQEMEITSVAQRKADTETAAGKLKLAEAIRAEAAAPGLAQAEVETEMAKAIKATGLAEAEVAVKGAEGLRAQGKAEAENIRDKGIAKAEGEEASYKAMASIDEETRQHEINRLNIEKDEKVAVAHVEANRQVGVEKAQAMGAAMSKADMQIIGDSTMYAKIMDSMSNGKALDARFENSEVLSAFAGEYLNGERSLPTDLAEILKKSDVSTGDIGTMLLAKLAADGGIEKVLEAFSSSKAKS